MRPIDSFALRLASMFGSNRKVRCRQEAHADARSAGSVPCGLTAVDVQDNSRDK